MTRIFLQKIYIAGEEHIYECSIDDTDHIHFIHGKSSGRSSMNDVFINEIIGELTIDFPRLKDMIQHIEDNYEYSEDLNNMDIHDEKINYITIVKNGDVRIDSMLTNIETKKIKEINISKKFLLDSYRILEKMWIDE